MSRQLTVLVADDSDDVRSAVGGFLRSFGHNVTSVRTGKEASAFLDRTYFDLVISALVMADGTGLEVIAETKWRYPSARIVVMLDDEFVEDPALIWELAAQKGAHRSIRKPFTPEELMKVLSEVVPPSDTAPPFHNAT